MAVTSVSALGSHFGMEWAVKASVWFSQEVRVLVLRPPILYLGVCSHKLSSVPFVSSKFAYWVKPANKVLNPPESELFPADFLGLKQNPRLCQPTEGITLASFFVLI